MTFSILSDTHYAVVEQFITLFGRKGDSEFAKQTLITTCPSSDNATWPHLSECLPVTYESLDLQKLHFWKLVHVYLHPGPVSKVA